MTQGIQRQPIRAAVAREVGRPLQFEIATLAAPRDNKVLVRMVATGVCHTAMVVRDQQFTTPLPIILGHEGAGVVEQVAQRDDSRAGRPRGHDLYVLRPMRALRDRPPGTVRTWARLT